MQRGARLEEDRRSGSGRGLSLGIPRRRSPLWRSGVLLPAETGDDIADRGLQPQSRRSEQHEGVGELKALDSGERIPAVRASGHVLDGPHATTLVDYGVIGDISRIDRDVKS